MKFKELAEDWKRVGMCITVAGTIAAAAVGAELHFAKAADLKQMQLAQNYSNFQMRLAALTELCEKTQCDANSKQMIVWLKAQIKMIEKEMSMTN